MSDAVTSARSARESLAKGLNALQADPNVPPHLLDLAQPIAQAMGALHQIERSGGQALVPHAENAIQNVRTALAQLQGSSTSHPAVMAAMEAVAASLGLVHSLAKMAQAPAPAPQAYEPPPQAYQPPPQAPVYQPPAPAYQPPPQAAYPAPAAYPDPFQQGPTAFQRPSADAFQQSPLPAQQMFQPAPAPMHHAPPSFETGGTVPVTDLPMVNADLGAHSPTNFYKGLSGNDIIDHGGLFISTYKIPKIGTPVRLKVSLPGGYEFEANAVVRWARESAEGGNDAPPGFGAQFTEITNEARQLVYRYVRNREPLFHDDL